MTGSRSSNDNDNRLILNNNDDDDSDEDESEIVEESPCGRWAKRREEVMGNFKKSFFTILLENYYHYHVMSSGFPR